MKRSSKITVLNVSNCENVTDAGLTSVLFLPPSLPSPPPSLPSLAAIPHCSVV
jgi:hypothetical protein